MRLSNWTKSQCLVTSPSRTTKCAVSLLEFMPSSHAKGRHQRNSRILPCAYYRHAVCTFEQGKMRHSSTVRSSRCLGRAGEGGLCLECTKVRVLLQRKSERSLRGVTQRLATTTPLRRLAKERLVTALRDSRESVRQLTKDKATILKKLTTECVPVNDSLHKSLKDVLIAEDITDPFLKMFWSEQSKAFSKQKGGMRWHPMLITLKVLRPTTRCDRLVRWSCLGNPHWGITRRSPRSAKAKDN